MENVDVLVLRILRDWRLAGRRALLATVVRTWGSSPRPVGSIMALCEDGAVVGSVSGGCIADDRTFEAFEKIGEGGRRLVVTDAMVDCARGSQTPDLPLLAALLLQVRPPGLVEPDDRLGQDVLQDGLVARLQQLREGRTLVEEGRLFHRADPRCDGAVLPAEGLSDSSRTGRRASRVECGHPIVRR